MGKIIEFAMIIRAKERLHIPEGGVLETNGWVGIGFISGGDTGKIRFFLNLMDAILNCFQGSRHHEQAGGQLFLINAR